MCFSPHLQFNNLTLISPHGLPGELDPDETREHMTATSHCYSHEEYAKVPMPAPGDFESAVAKADRRFTGIKPKNLLTVNDAYDAATLLNMGVAGKNINMVQPSPQYEVCTAIRETLCYQDMTNVY
ncbi:hypothetical protein DPMN_101909 [Dreissena polymorpha]|uniref:Uncharacterized protein n=1 Tax=Dreissena polymorpha TaxID=45954 RepID=A0A9D4LIH7_DREPO|nr:hypothetical protein DPMN_101909 [Dreissena polymorpha]